MKRQELYNLKNVLSSLRELRCTKFAYAVIKNLKKIDKELDILQELQKMDPALQPFEDQRLALCKKHAKKKDDGEFVVENNSFVIEDMETFNVEFLAIREQHKEVLEAQEKKQQEFHVLLQEDVKIDFHMIAEADLPSELNVSQLEVLEVMIKS